MVEPGAKNRLRRLGKPLTPRAFMFDPYRGFGLVPNRRPLSFLLCLVPVASSTTLVTLAAPSAQSGSVQRVGSTPLGPIGTTSSRPVADPELTDASGSIPVVVAFDPSARVELIAKLLQSVRIRPAGPPNLPSPP